MNSSHTLKEGIGLILNPTFSTFSALIKPFLLFSFSVEESKRIEEFYEEKMFCHHCDDSLAGHRYVLRDDHPYCIKCYENVFANNCDECGKIIGIDSKVSHCFIDVQIFFFFLNWCDCTVKRGSTRKLGQKPIWHFPRSSPIGDISGSSWQGWSRT